MKNNAPPTLPYTLAKKSYLEALKAFFIVLFSESEKSTKNKGFTTLYATPLILLESTKKSVGEGVSRTRARKGILGYV